MTPSEDTGYIGGNTVMLDLGHDDVLVETFASSVDEDKFFKYTRDVNQTLLKNILVDKAKVLDLQKPVDIIERLYGYTKDKKMDWWSSDSKDLDKKTTREIKKEKTTKLSVFAHPEHILFFDVWDAWPILTSFNNFIDSATANVNIRAKTLGYDLNKPIFIQILDGQTMSCFPFTAVFNGDILLFSYILTEISAFAEGGEATVMNGTDYGENVKKMNVICMNFIWQQNLVKMFQDIMHDNILWKGGRKPSSSKPALAREKFLMAIGALRRICYVDYDNDGIFYWTIQKPNSQTMTLEQYNALLMHFNNIFTKLITTYYSSELGKTKYNEEREKNRLELELLDTLKDNYKTPTTITEDETSKEMTRIQIYFNISPHGDAEKSTEYPFFISQSSMAQNILDSILPSMIPSSKIQKIKNMVSKSAFSGLFNTDNCKPRTAISDEDPYDNKKLCVKGLKKLTQSFMADIDSKPINKTDVKVLWHEAVISSSIFSLCKYSGDTCHLSISLTFKDACDTSKTNNQLQENCNTIREKLIQGIDGVTTAPDFYSKTLAKDVKITLCLKERPMAVRTTTDEPQFGNIIIGGLGVINSYLGVTDVDNGYTIANDPFEMIQVLLLNEFDIIENAGLTPSGEEVLKIIRPIIKTLGSAEPIISAETAAGISSDSVIDSITKGMFINITEISEVKAFLELTDDDKVDNAFRYLIKTLQDNDGKSIQTKLNDFKPTEKELLRLANVNTAVAQASYFIKAAAAVEEEKNNVLRDFRNLNTALCGRKTLLFPSEIKRSPLCSKLTYDTYISEGNAFEEMMPEILKISYGLASIIPDFEKISDAIKWSKKSSKTLSKAKWEAAWNDAVYEWIIHSKNIVERLELSEVILTTYQHNMLIENFDLRSKDSLPISLTIQTFIYNLGKIPDFGKIVSYKKNYSDQQKNLLSLLEELIHIANKYATGIDFLTHIQELTRPGSFTDYVASKDPNLFPILKNNSLSETNKSIMDKLKTSLGKLFTPRQGGGSTKRKGDHDDTNTPQRPLARQRSATQAYAAAAQPAATPEPAQDDATTDVELECMKKAICNIYPILQDRKEACIDAANRYIDNISSDNLGIVSDDQVIEKPIVYYFKNMAYAEYVTSLIQYSLNPTSDDGMDEPEASETYVIGFTIDDGFMKNVDYVKAFIKDIIEDPIEDTIEDSKIIDLYISTSEIGKALYVDFDKRFNEEEYITNIIDSFTYYSKYTYPEDNEWFFPELYIVFLYTFIFGYESVDGLTRDNLTIQQQRDQLRGFLGHLQEVLQHVDSGVSDSGASAAQVDSEMRGSVDEMKEGLDESIVAPALSYSFDRDLIPYSLQQRYTLDFNGSLGVQDRPDIKSHLTKICTQFITNATSIEYDDEDDMEVKSDQLPTIQFRIKSVFDTLKTDLSTTTAITNAEDAEDENFSTVVVEKEKISDADEMDDAGNATANESSAERTDDMDDDAKDYQEQISQWLQDNGYTGETEAARGSSLLADYLEKNKGQLPDSRDDLESWHNLSGGGRKNYRNKSRKRQKRRKYSKKNTKTHKKHTRKRCKKHKKSTKRKR